MVEKEEQELRIAYPYFTDGRAIVCQTRGTYADREAAVADTVERIGRGELYQANIARTWAGRLRAGAGPFDVSR